MYKLNRVGFSKPIQTDTLYVPPFATLPAALSLLPEVYEIFDQAQEGSCTANASCGAFELILKRAGVPQHLSRNFLYSNSKASESDITEDGIMMCRNVFISAKYSGVCLESFFPYVSSDQSTIPPEAAILDGKKRTIGGYENISFMEPHYSPLPDFEVNQYDPIISVKNALNEGCPVFTALSVGSAMYNLRGPWKDQVYSPTDVVGGHAMLIVGYDDSVQKFQVVNSWGAGWGDNGVCGLPYSAFKNCELWAIRGFGGVETPHVPGIRLVANDGTNLVARINPKPAEIGITVNVWIGAMYENKKWIKSSLTDDLWTEFTGTITPCGSITLEEDTDVMLVNDTSITPFKGAQVYLAYGKDVQTWTMAKVCEL